VCVCVCGLRVYFKSARFNISEVYSYFNYIGMQSTMMPDSSCIYLFYS